jgi:hypothetical protein
MTSGGQTKPGRMDGDRRLGPLLIKLLKQSRIVGGHLPRTQDFKGVIFFKECPI